MENQLEVGLSTAPITTPLETFAPIQTIVTTLGFSSLEAPFFNALLTMERVRRQLGITRGKINWRFVSTWIPQKPTENPIKVQQALREKGIVHFNVGHAAFAGEWDQHGRPKNKSLCELCSLDLVRGKYDFLQRRPWLTTIYQAVRNNDVYGTTLCQERNNLRRLMMGLGIIFRDEPKKMLEAMTLAFHGVFERSKQNYPVDEALSLDSVKTGVKIYCQDDLVQWQEFCLLADQAEQTILADEIQARQDIDQAENQYNFSIIKHPIIAQLMGKKIRIILVHSYALTLAKLTRTWRKKKIQGEKKSIPPYDLTIVVQSTGNFQIFSSTLNQLGGKDAITGKRGVVGKWRFNLGPIAKSLRLAEANLSYPCPDRESDDWDQSGMVYYENGWACPLYLTEFLAAILNGSLSAPDVPPTKIPHDKILMMVSEFLPTCPLLREDPQGKWHRVIFTPDGHWQWAK